MALHKRSIRKYDLLSAVLAFVQAKRQPFEPLCRNAWRMVGRTNVDIARPPLALPLRCMLPIEER